MRGRGAGEISARSIRFKPRGGTKGKFITSSNVPDLTGRFWRFVVCFAPVLEESKHEYSSGTFHGC
jgi:hypothetical protein